MKKPKISIIVPVYNVENYLEKCLESLINQTLIDIEIICIDDGSTDFSSEILRHYDYNVPKITVLCQQNKGQSAARNLGIRHANGEYLAFVDSDDWVDLDYFEKLYTAAKENDCDIACAGFKRCGKIKKSIRKSFKEKRIYTDINDKVKIDNLPEHNYIWNKIYRRDKWNFEFREGRYFEDMAILIQILYGLGNMVTVPDTYYNYRKNQGSTVTLKTRKHKEDFIWAKNEMYKFAQSHNIKLTNTKGYEKKETIKILGLPIFKIYYYTDSVILKLFGFIPLASKNIW